MTRETTGTRRVGARMMVNALLWIIEEEEKRVLENIYIRGDSGERRKKNEQAVVVVERTTDWGSRETRFLFLSLCKHFHCYFSSSWWWKSCRSQRCWNFSRGDTKRVNSTYISFLHLLIHMMQRWKVARQQQSNQYIIISRRRRIHFSDCQDNSLTHCPLCLWGGLSSSVCGLSGVEKVVVKCSA